MAGRGQGFTPKNDGHSKPQQDKAALKRIRGTTLPNDAKRLTMKTIDLILERWFAGVGLNNIAEEMGRSVTSIKSIIFKHITNVRSQAEKYQPHPNRLKPKGPLTTNERAAVATAFSIGQDLSNKERKRPMTLALLAKVLNRPEKDILAYRKKICHPLS